MRFQVAGLVQGVGYRRSVKGFVEAEGLKLLGYVRNLPDGSVEVVAQGDQADLDLLHQFCLKGPIRSRVQRVEVTPLPQTDPLSAFDIKY